MAAELVAPDSRRTGLTIAWIVAVVVVAVPLALNLRGHLWGSTRVDLSVHMTRILATELKDEGVLVNSACPGFVKTDMGGPMGAQKPVEEGAKGIVWLATLPDDGPTGGFFRDGKPVAF